jgi:hypothetical protein
MSLTDKQNDWSNLLYDDAIGVPLPDRGLTGNLTDEDRLNVAALWVTDGIHARHTDYPKSSREVQYLKLSRSAWLRSCYNLAVVLQLCATFLDNRNCDHDNSKNDYNFLHPDGSPTRLTLTVFDLACLVLYLYDLFLVFAVNPTSKSLLHKPWSAFRLFICLFVFLDCLLYFTDPAQPRLMRCVFPFLLISKRNNLKLMCQGLLISAYKSLPIIKALVCILLIWGFVGFVFFRATDGNDHAFQNPGKHHDCKATSHCVLLNRCVLFHSGIGIAEALHCFTSRPYVLKSLSTIYANNQASTLYFVTLTLAADILCIALIVATGAKHYKQFAANILHNRLVDRRHAVTCAFHAIAVPPDTGNTSVDGSCANDTAADMHAAGDSTAHSSLDSADPSRSSVSRSDLRSSPGSTPEAIDSSWRVSRQRWMQLCAGMGGKYVTTPHTANFIFDMAVNADPRQSAQGGSARPSHSSDLPGEGYSGGSEAGGPSEYLHSVDKYLFFRCCALLAARIVVQMESAVHADAADSSVSGSNHDRISTLELTQRVSAMYGSGEGRKSISSRAAGGGMMTVFSPAVGVDQRESISYGRRSLGGIKTGPRENENLDAGRDSDTGPDGLGEPQYDVTMVSVNAQLNEQSERLSQVLVLRVSERVSTGSALTGKHSSAATAGNRRQRSFISRLEREAEQLAELLRPVQELCVRITGATATVRLFSRDHTINLFYATNIFLIALLVSALCRVHMCGPIFAIVVLRHTAFA